MFIAQISDLHCREAQSSMLLGVDINRNIASAVARLNALSPRPDLVIATGDLTGGGKPDQYAALDALLAPLEMPLYLLPGNHDEREPFLAAFAGRYGVEDNDADFMQTVIDTGPLRLVALDTIHPGHHNGGIPDERLAWLDGTLAAAADAPTLIYMHHPPFRTGIWWMDRLGILDGLNDLADVLGRHDQVVGMVAGHLHRTIHATFAGVPVTVAPTTCYAVDLDIHDEAAPKVTAEPPGFMLHWWQADTLVSHTLFLDGHEVEDVTALMHNWPARLERMREHLPVPKALGAIE